jgi:hypothetical protein
VRIRRIVGHSRLQQTFALAISSSFDLRSRRA